MSSVARRPEGNPSGRLAIVGAVIELHPKDT